MVHAKQKVLWMSWMLKKVCIRLVNFQVKAMMTGFLCTVGYGSIGDLQGPGLHPGSLVSWEVVGMSGSAVSLACRWRWPEKRHRCVTVLSEKDSFLQDLWAMWSTSWSTSFPSIFLFSFSAQQLLCRPKWSEWLPETTVISFPFTNCWEAHYPQQRSSNIWVTCLLTLHHQWELTSLITLMYIHSWFFSPDVLWKSGNSVYLAWYWPLFLAGKGMTFQTLYPPPRHHPDPVSAGGTIPLEWWQKDTSSMLNISSNWFGTCLFCANLKIKQALLHIRYIQPFQKSSPIPELSKLSRKFSSWHEDWVILYANRKQQESGP